MKVIETVKLPLVSSIQVGTHFGFPAARYLEGSVVKKSFLGPFAEKRAWRAYHRDDARIPVYEEGSMVEPDLELPEELLRP